MEDTKLQIEPVSFIAQASTQLTKADQKLLKLLELEASIPILISLLYREEPQELPIAYNQSFWEAFLEYARYKEENKDAPMPVRFKELPEAFLSLVIEFIPLEEKPDKLIFEHRFYQGLYEFAARHRNTFVRAWFDYRRTARNIILALNGRSHKLDYAPWLVGDDELTQQLATGRGSDFGIGKSSDIFEDYLRAYEQNTVLYRERSYDTLAWKFIDDLNFFQYFSIDKVLGYYAQLLILSRWLSFDVEKGKQVFFDTLSSLRDSFSFPAEFNIKQKTK